MTVYYLISFKYKYVHLSAVIVSMNVIATSSKENVLIAQTKDYTIGMVFNLVKYQRYTCSLTSLVHSKCKQIIHLLGHQIQFLVKYKFWVVSINGKQ
jgi:hypothetical protein